MEAEEEDQNQLELLCTLIPLRQTYTLWFLLASHVFFAITAILGNSLYHSCSLPGVVSSSAFQDAASLSGTHRPFCWPSRGSHLYRVFNNAGC